MYTDQIGLCMRGVRGQGLMERQTCRLLSQNVAVLIHIHRLNDGTPVGQLRAYGSRCDPVL